MVEKGSKIPESVISSLGTQGERGSLRFSLRRVLLGATIGAIVLPLLSFGIGGALGVFSNVSASEIPALLSVGSLQVITGAALGALIAAKRS